MIRIFRVLVPAGSLILFLAEVALVSACYVAGAYSDPDIDGDIFLGTESGWLRIGIVVILTILGLYFNNLYADTRVPTRTRLLQQLCLITGIVFLAQALIGFMDREFALPRKIMLMGSAMALVSIFVLRLLFGTAIRQAAGSRRVLFVGMTATVARLVEHLVKHPELGLTPIGYLDRREDDSGANGALTWLGEVGDLGRVIEERHPDWLIIGKRKEIPPWWADDFLELRFGGIRAERASSLYESTFGRVSTLEIQPSELIFGDALEPSPVWMSLQPAYSFALAAIAFLVLLPVLLFIALLVKATSRGPVLQRELRVGLHASVFPLYRFRCRYGETSGRLTPIGRILRKSHLDGLPQLLNVLRGDLSLVGPRAIRPEFASRLGELVPFYARRHLVKPGLTGWARVNGDGHAGIPDALAILEYDLHYIRSLSPAFDFLILLSAIRLAFSPR